MSELVAELAGVWRRTIEGSWSLRFWYRCLEHPEFGAAHRDLVHYHFHEEHSMEGYDIHLLTDTAEDAAVADKFALADRAGQS